MRVFPFGADCLSGAVFLGTACALAGYAHGWSPTNASFSLFSLYETAADYRQVVDMGAAIEAPVRNGYTGVTRARFRKDRVETVAERTAAFQASLRRHPWEWMPGFFAEVLAGYASVRRENLQRKTPAGTNFTARQAFAAKASTSISFSQPPPMDFSRMRTWEAGIGFGYAWDYGRMRVSVGMLFGPEYRFSDETRIDGLYTASEDWGNAGLLRFNHLDLGYSF